MKYYLLLLFSLSIITASTQNLPQSFIKKSKSPQSEDSIIALARLSSQFYNYFNTTKATYQKLDSIIGYSKNPSNQQFNIPGSKNMFIYDINGNINNVSFFTWDSQTNSWFKRNDQQYSNNGKTIIATDYTVNKSKTITTLSYNSTGKLILSQSLHWNYVMNQWIDTTRYTYDYNANNQISSIVKTIHVTTPNQFLYEFKYKYTYNSNNLLILFEHKTYNYNTQLWQNYDKKEYTYNSSGEKVSEICSEWYYTNWELLCKDDYSYDSQGNLTLDFIYFWLINKWDPDQKLEYQYDNNNNMIEVRRGGFNTNGQFVYYERNRRMYDLSVSSNQLILPPSLIGQFNNKLTEREGDQRNGNTWNQTNKILYFYSNISITAIEDSDQLKIELYPNPAQSYINIKTSQKQKFYNSTYEIININGQKLLSGEDIYLPIDITSLNPGLYFIKITNDNKTILNKRFVTY